MVVHNLHKKNWHVGGMGMKDYKIICRTACLFKKKKTWAPQTAEFMTSALDCFDILGYSCFLHFYATVQPCSALRSSGYLFVQLTPFCK